MAQGWNTGNASATSKRPMLWDDNDSTVITPIMTNEIISFINSLPNRHRPTTFSAAIDESSAKQVLGGKSMNAAPRVDADLSSWSIVIKQDAPMSCTPGLFLHVAAFLQLHRGKLNRERNETDVRLLNICFLLIGDSYFDSCWVGLKNNNNNPKSIGFVILKKETHWWVCKKKTQKTMRTVEE